MFLFRDYAVLFDYVLDSSVIELISNIKNEKTGRLLKRKTQHLFQINLAFLNRKSRIATSRFQKDDLNFETDEK